LTLEEAKRVLYVAHVGDSSAYLIDDNSAEKLTPEHRCDNQA
jgi:serine/threonine protein phosphatase PrpC